MRRPPLVAGRMGRTRRVGLPRLRHQRLHGRACRRWWGVVAGFKRVSASVLSVADDMMALPAGEPAVEGCKGPAMFRRILAVGVHRSPSFNIIFVA